MNVALEKYLANSKSYSILSSKKHIIFIDACRSPLTGMAIYLAGIILLYFLIKCRKQVLKIHFLNTISILEGFFIGNKELSPDEVLLAIEDEIQNKESNYFSFKAVSGMW